MTRYDLYAIGNALVDSEYKVTDAQLQAMGVDKSHMTLIDADRAAELQRHLQGIETHRSGGGSAGNTVVALAQFGGKAFYSCRVGDDELGAFYIHDLAANGVDTNLTQNPPQAGVTGSCTVLITADAERSMSTFLGATAELNATALQPQDLQNAKVYYMEGYLASSPTGLQAALKGRQIALDSGIKLATTLSDVSMIRFCRDGLTAIIGDRLDYLFCNEEEAHVWCGTSDLDAIYEQMGKLAATVCLTRGPQGCVVIEGSSHTAVPTDKVTAVDTNGAGDMFAGAFLYGITQGYSHLEAARFANRAAGELVSRYGNRMPQDAMDAIKAAFVQQSAA